jgi:telomere length regulation protein
LFEHLAIFEKIKILTSILLLMNKRFLTTPKPAQQRVIGGLAHLLKVIIGENVRLLDYLVDWLAGVSGGSVGFELAVRRAVIATLSTFGDYQEQALKKLMIQFGDKLYIQHAPILNQETCIQNLLLLAGRLYRANQSEFRSLSKSGMFITGVSSRLAASAERPRFLGMIVGTAISELADAPDKRMKFKVDTMSSSDAEWYQNLTGVQDSIGKLEDLKLIGEVSQTQSEPKKISNSQLKPNKSKIIAIQEISDEESSDDDLPVYAKPDSDAEDEEEDPTLIQRNKPVAPVYIRDLILGLRNSENYDGYRLAISTAASLIRRKANFGTEVIDHIEELAARIAGLKDEYEIEKFQEYRLQAMVAVIVAQPVKMGQWFSNMIFSGDYSMSQRASMLTALTMAARELAGFREEDADLTGAFVANEALFPSKKLPDKYEKIYRIEAAPVEAASRKLEQLMVKPIVAEAADQMSGPKALKVRTFSSRMEIEKKRKRPITNELAKVVSDGFFFPLTGRWQAYIHTHGKDNLFSTPFLQAHFLKTLALILSASGTSTLSLPALTTEFWALLLTTRAEALNARPVLESLLFGLLTVLDINGNDQRQIAVEHSQELLETQAWVEQLFENLGAGSTEDDRIRMLAAGVLVRAKEVMDKYQRLLVDEIAGL